MARKKKSSIAEIIETEEALTEEVHTDEVINPEDLLSTGSTMLNLSCSNNPHGAFLKGRLVNIVGDSGVGKTLLSLSLVAEASIDPNFKDYDLILRDNEARNNFPIGKYFGKKLKRILAETSKDENGEYIKYPFIEDYFYELENIALKAKSGDGKPAVHILDSLDSITDKASAKKWEEQKKAHENDNQASGSYQMTKQKFSSNAFQQTVRAVADSGIVQVILSQVRSKIDAQAFGKKTSRSGGKALTFYANHEIWVAKLKTLKKDVRGQKVITGHKILAKIEKNSLTGNECSVEITVLKGYGIDDITDCIEYLLKWKHWKGTKASISAPEFSEDRVSMKKLVEIIENQEPDENGHDGHWHLAELCGKVWNQVLAEVEPKRKKRYE